MGVTTFVEAASAKIAVVAARARIEELYGISRARLAAVTLGAGSGEDDARTMEAYAESDWIETLPLETSRG